MKVSEAACATENFLFEEEKQFPRSRLLFPNGLSWNRWTNEKRSGKSWMWFNKSVFCNFHNLELLGFVFSRPTAKRCKRRGEKKQPKAPPFWRSFYFCGEHNFTRVARNVFSREFQSRENKNNKRKTHKSQFLANITDRKMSKMRRDFTSHKLMWELFVKNVTLGGICEGPKS